MFSDAGRAVSHRRRTVVPLTVHLGFLVLPLLSFQFFAFVPGHFMRLLRTAPDAIFALGWLRRARSDSNVSCASLPLIGTECLLSLAQILRCRSFTAGVSLLFSKADLSSMIQQWSSVCLVRLGVSAAFPCYSNLNLTQAFAVGPVSAASSLPKAHLSSMSSSAPTTTLVSASRRQAPVDALGLFSVRVLRLYPCWAWSILTSVWALFRLSSSMGSSFWSYYFGYFSWSGYTSILRSYLKHQDALPPQSQSSSCHGQERSLAPFSYYKESFITPSSLLPWLLYCCPYVVRPALVLEGCSSETSLSVGFNGSANWCFVTPVLLANFGIVLLALVADSITSSISLSMCCVVQGVFSLISTRIIKVQGLRDNVFCLSARIALIYPPIYYPCVSLCSCSSEFDGFEGSDPFFCNISLSEDD
ncbi:unnamed protein product [Arabidopsis lyrata]|uniref:Predicted protein n=1 Tax=Arabidopsis lyrata subsp. lyrata TaxID=81972 RepID=D7KBX5_ARALL|nr:predicted protein [Arabidopsis lyrata subsp. lyrata]CAH8254840.1 unnamed protein product [Arabidopsis lyrata]